MTYNQDGSDFYKLAETLSKRWDEKYSKLLGDMAPAAHTAAAASGAAAAEGSNAAQIKDRQTFARSLYNITKEDLGKVLVELESKCPAAITRNAQEDEVELNVDKIPPALLAELRNFVSSCVAKNKTTKKKAPPKTK
jgi:hypothetical protein